MSTATALKTILLDKLKNDGLVLPTLPEIALKVRDMVNDPDSNLKMLAALISQDASLSARMICIANTSHFSRAVRVDNLPAALNRIGGRQINNIATALAMEQLFVSDNEVVARCLKKSWVESSEITAHALALLNLYRQREAHCNLQADSMLLVALVHNIGVLPILAEADHYPEVFADVEFLDRAIEQLKFVIGAAVVKAWHFADETVETLVHFADEDYQTAEISYLDFVRLAVLCCEGDIREDERAERLAPYIAKGVLASEAVMEDEVFVAELEAARSTFA